MDQSKSSESEDIRASEDRNTLTEHDAVVDTGQQRLQRERWRFYTSQQYAQLSIILFAHHRGHPARISTKCRKIVKRNCKNAVSVTSLTVNSALCSPTWAYCWLAWFCHHLSPCASFCVFVSSQCVFVCFLGLDAAVCCLLCFLCVFVSLCVFCFLPFAPLCLLPSFSVFFCSKHSKYIS